MRILVFSDTHGDINGCIKVIDAIPTDRILHLGDIMRDIYDLKALYPHIPVDYVAGNNDWGCGADSKVITLEGKTIFMAHGHMHGVSYGNGRIIDAAKRAGASIALYGHTHRAECTKEDGIQVMCPGSVSRPRGEAPSCGIIEIENGKIGMAIYNL